MNKISYFSGLIVVLGSAVVNTVHASEHSLRPALVVEWESTMPVAVDVNKQPAQLLSAFFGLDNDLPFRANALCFGASGKDGMPIVLSHTVAQETLQPEAFQIVTRSGEVRTPECVTLRPAQDPGERRTVLLIGDLGDAVDNPPLSVQVVGDLLSDGASVVNFNGAYTDVTPLDAGPSIVLAEEVPESEWARKTRGTVCPAGIQQIVRITWNGGVRLPNGNEPGDAERRLYRVRVERRDGSNDEINPVALAELGDGDNNHFLCLDTADPAVEVSFPAGRLVDPNQDLNAYTHIGVSRGVN